MSQRTLCITFLTACIIVVVSTVEMIAAPLSGLGTRAASSWPTTESTGNPLAIPETAYGLQVKKKRRNSRRYTLRGNPDVTRKIATQLIIEKLPNLAALVGLDGPGQDQPLDIDDSEDSDPTTDLPESSVVTHASMVSYDDSELADEEDPDRISADDEAMLAQQEDLSIDDFYDEFTSYMASLNGDTYVTYNGIDMEVGMATLVDWLGTRYLFGGVTRRGIDCSAFTRMMYRTLGYQLPRTAAAQWDYSDDEIDRNELQFGDLVFFHTRKGVYVGHVGMYLGNDLFAHASSRNGVTVSSLTSNYYSSHFIGARRYDVAGALVEAEKKREAAESSDT